jgi:aerobic-type carbon monoxide dehydrogenase small subunit (CoxS/CutS family)
MPKVDLLVNGQEHRVSVASGALLLDVLRNQLGLTGVKRGCEIGVCGLCTVLLDDNPASSCLQLTETVGNRRIRTVESLADGSQLSALQDAFVDHAAFQCGICTSGQLMAAQALLERCPQPTREQVTAWMSGNLCRCTGYYQIVEAVLDAAERRR